jgi:hypothetical protein
MDTYFSGISYLENVESYVKEKLKEKNMNTRRLEWWDNGKRITDLVQINALRPQRLPNLSDF